MKITGVMGLGNSHPETSDGSSEMSASDPSRLPGIEAPHNDTQSASSQTHAGQLRHAPEEDGESKLQALELKISELEAGQRIH